VPQGTITLELETDQTEDAITRTMRTVADIELESIALVVKAPARAAAVERGRPEPRRGPGARAHHSRSHRGDGSVPRCRLESCCWRPPACVSCRRGMPEVLRPPLDEAVDRLHLLVKGLHDKVMAARMTPIAVITDRLPRAARDIARRRGRDVDLVITGEDIELDRAIVDELADPVLHLLRNAIDHGVETPDERKAAGKPASRQGDVDGDAAARPRGARARDDGRGIDVERLKALVVERGLMTPDSDAAALGARWR
jgi:two-component system chemotaxis sensor kinase CheA